MTWYKFSAKNSGPGGQCVEYFWFYGEDDKEDYIEEVLDDWAFKIYGHGDRPYSAKLERVDYPPKTVLEEMIAHTRTSIDKKKQYLSLLENTLAEVSGKIDGKSRDS